MKSIAAAVVLTVSLVGLAGCVSKSYDRGAVTAVALQTSASAVSETSARVNDVLGALNSLTFKPQGDLRNQFDAFTAAVAKLNGATGKLESTVVEMRVKAADYFENWSNELATIQSDEIRKRSATRRDEVIGKLLAVNHSYDEVNGSFKTFGSDLKDIQTYLGTDLTLGGLDTIKDIMARTKTDAVPLRDAVKKLQADFSDLGTALSPFVPGPEK